MFSNSLIHWGWNQMSAIWQTEISNAFSLMKCILIQMAKFVLKDSINNIPALVEMMAWYRSGNKPLYEPMTVQFTDAYMRHSTWMN